MLPHFPLVNKLPLDDPRWLLILTVFGIVIAVGSELANILAPINPDLAAIVFLITLFSLPIIFRRLRKLKRITCQVISNLSVLSIKEAKEVKGRVQVLFDNKPVGDVQLITLKVWNSGNVDIKLEDYYDDNPIEMELGEEAQVLDVEILETRPESLFTNLKPLLKFNAGNISIDPISLISKSYILLKVLITKFDGKFEISKTKLIDGNVIDPNKTVYFRLINYFTKFDVLFLGIAFVLSLFISYPLSYLIVNSLSLETFLFAIIAAYIWLPSSFLIYYLIILLKR
jgi:hypothetical protein